MPHQFMIFDLTISKTKILYMFSIQKKERNLRKTTLEVYHVKTLEVYNVKTLEVFVIKYSLEVIC